MYVHTILTSFIAQRATGLGSWRGTQFVGPAFFYSIFHRHIKLRMKSPEVNEVSGKCRAAVTSGECACDQDQVHF
jgi:hypothetical protein